MGFEPSVLFPPVAVGRGIDDMDRKLFYESILDFSVQLLTIISRTNRFGFLLMFVGATRIIPSKISNMV